MRMLYQLTERQEEWLAVADKHGTCKVSSVRLLSESSGILLWCCPPTFPIPPQNNLSRGPNPFCICPLHAYSRCHGREVHRWALRLFPPEQQPFISQWYRDGTSFGAYMMHFLWEDFCFTTAAFFFLQPNFPSKYILLVCVSKGKELFWEFAATSRLEQVLTRHLRTHHICLVIS